METELITYCQNLVTFLGTRCAANSSQFHCLFEKQEIEKICLELETILSKEDPD